MRHITERLPDRLRLPLTLDVARLQQDLENLRGVTWIEHFVKQNYTGYWSVIPLRAQAGATHPVMMIYSNPGTRDYEDTPFLAQTPYIRDVLSGFHCVLQAVRLMQLTPGSAIKEHSDGDLSAEDGTVRLHVPITTNPSVKFLLNRTNVVMEPGSVWYLRLSDPHSAINAGQTTRVHLVIDALVNDWLGALLASAAHGIDGAATDGQTAANSG